MKVPFVDLSEQYLFIQNEVQAVVNEVLDSKNFISGPYVKKFESEFAQFTNSKFCIGVGNGTDALFLAMKALDIGVGNEVIVPANTFIATSEAVTLNGARVVFVDCHPETYTIDLSKIASHITPLTRAIIPVHLYGHPVDLVELSKIANEKGLFIVQDCAQAHGAKIKNNHLSNYGDIQCYSFYPGKNLGAFGDAGAVTTNNEYL
ncbi:erythromycin biosynthesis sensory transduction protein eryC1, partial [Candidatus Magnetomorum sp. HK-1]